MILKENLSNVLVSQKKSLLDKLGGINRELFSKIVFSSSHAQIVSGVRRCGKSTLLHQIAKSKKKFCYINFDDARLSEFEVSDTQKLIDVFEDMENGCDYFFFDEIQNVKEWEKIIRTFLDMEKKCFITGSNAHMLSKELGTRLTGRHITKELYPFSFSEYLEFTNKKGSDESFMEYLQKGGMPEYLKFLDEEILRQIFKDILIKDIMVRNNIANEANIEQIATHLISNIGKETTANSLKNSFKIGSANTLLSYMKYFEDSYLFFFVPLFSRSYKKQAVNPKKVFCIDCGIVKANSFSLSEDTGRLLENAVFIELKRRGCKVSYFKGSFECDFVAENQNKEIEIYQICSHLTQDNIAREISGLNEAKESLKPKKAVIITLNQTDSVKGFLAIPAWKWMLNVK